MTLNEDWEREALRWAAWARRPGHDSYWYFSGPAFFRLLPPPGRRTLDLGCGEGRVARDLAMRGHRVTGIDAAPTLVRLAREADPAGEYLLADAAALPFEDAAFDLVVAFNSLMDRQDLAGAVRESARVLEPGGRLCVCVVHPLLEAGRFESEAVDAPFVIEGSYFGRRPTVVTEERDGLTMTFRGYATALEPYALALEEAGFLVEAIREPVPSAEVVEERPRWARARRVPTFLQLRAVNP